MSIRAKRIISFIIVVVLLIFSLCYLTRLMERKDSYEKYAEFLNQDYDFDVLFIGNSHVINGINPLQLWGDYGIVSYNLGGHSNQLATSYWVMKNALQYTSPKVVVIDGMSLSSNFKCSDVFSWMHISLDAFPLSLVKIQAINDLLNDPYLDEYIASGNARESTEQRTHIGLLWNYSIYHSRWGELTQNDFEPYYSKMKGYVPRMEIFPHEFVKSDEPFVFAGETVGEQYLRRMIEECKASGIDVLLTYIPFEANQVCQGEASYLKTIAEEYNIKYINFLDMNIVNFKTDFFDEASHLNIAGSRKVTGYLSKFLKDNYYLSDHTEDLEYETWHDSYNWYKNKEKLDLENQDELNQFLLLLIGQKYDVKIEVFDDKIKDNEITLELLDTLTEGGAMLYYKNMECDDNMSISIEISSAGWTIYKSFDMDT